MDRINIENKKNNAFMIGEDLTSKSFIFDCENSLNDYVIDIDDNVRANILIINVKENMNLSFRIGQYASLHLSILAKENADNLKITADVDKYGEIDVYFADFLQDQNKAKIDINLNGEESACAWHLASLAGAKDKKEFDVSVFHNTANTYCKLDNYGVCLNQSQLTFSGVCKINNGSSGSKAHQNAKIMVFDEECKGIARPILKIDENDIEASHAAVVGKINDDHLFYLTSRGLSESEAKELITLGYLKPILNGFDDEYIKEDITNLIEERL